MTRDGFLLYSPYFTRVLTLSELLGPFFQQISNTDSKFITCAAKIVGSRLCMKNTNRNRKPHCVIQRGNAKVPVYKRTKATGYVEFQVPDHITGKRKLWSFANEDEAKIKAKEIAEGAARGDHDLLALSGYKHRIFAAIEWIAPTGLKIDDACHLLHDASEIISPKQFLEACAFFKKHQPDKPFAPRSVEDAVREYGQMTHNYGWKRVKTLSSYLNRFSRQFAKQMLHDIDAVELKDFLDSRKSGPKTYNEYVRGIALLYKTAQFRGWVPDGCNPTVKITRRKEIAPTIEIFTPREVKTLLEQMAVVTPELVAPIALWAFSGVRLAEVGRLSWQQVNVGLQTGAFLLEARQTKTGRQRSVRLMPNLKLWLTKFNNEAGSLIPPYWLSPTKTSQNRLNELPRYIREKTGFRWADNWGRHSFGTYYFKQTKDAGEVVRQMGNNLKDFQRHYWNKSDCVDDDAAAEYFSIVPVCPANVIPLSDANPETQPGQDAPMAGGH